MDTENTQDQLPEEILPEIPQPDPVPSAEIVEEPTQPIEPTAPPADTTQPEGVAVPQAPSETPAEVTPHVEIPPDPLAPTDSIADEPKGEPIENPQPETIEEVVDKFAPVTEAEKVTLKDEERGEYRWWTNGAKLKLLRDAFLMGCDIGEACLYAEITRHQYEYYNREVDNDYAKKVELWRERPTLLARQTVVKAMKDDASIALKYLERRKKDEFGLRSEITATNGAPLSMVIDVVREKRTTLTP